MKDKEKSGENLQDPKEEESYMSRLAREAAEEERQQDGETKARLEENLNASREELQQLRLKDEEKKNRELTPGEIEEQKMADEKTNKKVRSFLEKIFGK